MAANGTSSSFSYISHPTPPLISGISDLHLSLVVPIATHWITSAFFELCEYLGLLQQYRLHTPAEELARNRVTRWECLRVTLQCQALQTLLGLGLSLFGAGDTTGSESYGLPICIGQVRAAFTALLSLLSLTGINAKVATAALSESRLYILIIGHHELEVLVGKALYWYIVPGFQFVITLVVADACMYLLHRLGHTSKWLYKNIHSQHHRLYVPYSWGGSYNHPIDSLCLDGMSYAVGCWASGISTRLSVFLFGYATFKNILDHCGYVFPWNPMRAITGTDAGFHDVHHQHWGLKTNYGAHLAIWDHMFGTYFTDQEKISRLRTKNRIAADELVSGAKQRGGH